MLARWKSELRAFRTRWRGRRLPRRGPDLRHLNALAVLAACGGIVAAALNLDAAGFAWAKSLSPPVIHVFEQITRAGDSLYVFVLTIMTAAWAVAARGPGPARVNAGLTQLAARAVYLFAVCAASGLASQALKHLFGRARPQLHDRYPQLIGMFHFDLFSISASLASFPSGHAVTAFAMATGLWFLARCSGYALFPLAFLVGLSRVAIGSHYASDVVAGAALGTASAMLLRRVFAARGLVFKPMPRGIATRGKGLIWRAVWR